ncbi:MAG: nitrilase family protein [Bacteroidales bacterium]|nr:nitrilase family protein [Bacteroidales bacterium]
MEDLNISIIQTDILWEKPQENLNKLDNILASDEFYNTSHKAAPDIIVLPEMFNTGFSMQPEKISDIFIVKTIEWMQLKALQTKALIVGSIIFRESNKHFNRLICMSPEGTYKVYDKRHLFGLAQENMHYTAGVTKLITKVKNWKIRPLICYDLRFPVWSKNILNNENDFDYDCLIYIANWPKNRYYIWKALLIARAIENQSFVIGVNRVGSDGYGVEYSGNSLIIDYAGKIIYEAEEGKEDIAFATFNYENLYKFRKHYNFSPDWDKFKLLTV